MQWIKIPHTDLSSSPIALGIALIGVSGSEGEGKANLDCFIEQGGNHIDTARVYSNWIPGETNRSERILGDWLAERKIRDQVLISTKGGHYFFKDGIGRLTPELMQEDLDGSLQTLRIDTIDLYWLHRDNPDCPVDAIMDRLHRFQKAGKIRSYAASNWSAPRIREANAYARRNGYDGFVASQVDWSIGTAHRLPCPDPTMLDFTADHLALHEKDGLAAIPYSSQALGYFSIRSRNADLVKESPYNTPGNQNIHDYLTSVAKDLGLSMTQMVLAYLWTHSFPVIPLVGCRTPEQIKDTLSSIGCRLPPSVMARLDEMMLNRR